MNRQTFGQRVKRLFAPVAVGLATAFKWALPLLKFGLPVLKVSAGMLISLWFYAMAFSWRFALGFIILLFIHESGHLLAARAVGLKVGLPVFIPFMGAVIALKEAPPNAWIEAVVGIGGPILGSIGAAGAFAVFFLTRNPLFLVLAYTGFFLNLFNLIPIVPLDGGRIVSAISPWLWVLGLAIIIPYLLYRLTLGGLLAGGTSFIIIFIVITSLPRVLALFRGRTPAQARYYQCTGGQRLLMAALYFSLLGSLYMGMAFITRLLHFIRA